MSKGFIEGIGGSSKLFAAIGASYPEGSECVCSNELFEKMVKGLTGTADGNLSNVETHITSADYIPVVSGVKYTVNAPSVNPGDTAGEHGVVFFKADQSFLSYSGFGAETFVYFTVPEEAAYMKLNFYVKTQPAEMPGDISVLSGERKKVLKAKGDRDKWIFNIPFTGTWNVTAKKDDTSKSAVVCINFEGQAEVVELGFGLVLFDAGTVNSIVGKFVGTTKKNENYGAASYSVSGSVLKASADSGMESYSYALISTQDGVDVTDYDTILFKVSKATRKETTGSPTLSLKVGVAKSSLDTTLAASATVTKTGVAEIDVSALSGKYYPTIYARAAGASGSSKRGNVEINVAKLWLE